MGSLCLSSVATTHKLTPFDTKNDAKACRRSWILRKGTSARFRMRPHCFAMVGLAGSAVYNSGELAQYRGIWIRAQESECTECH